MSRGIVMLQVSCTREARDRCGTFGANVTAPARKETREIRSRLRRRFGKRANRALMRRVAVGRFILGTRCQRSVAARI